MSDERQPSWPVPTAAVSEAWVDGHVHAFAFFGRVPQWFCRKFCWNLSAGIART
jgi:hypothetical protein